MLHSDQAQISSLESFLFWPPKLVSNLSFSRPWELRARGCLPSKATCLEVLLRENYITPRHSNSQESGTRDLYQGNKHRLGGWP